MMIKRIKPALAAAMLLTLTTTTALADNPLNLMKAETPAPATQVVNADGTISLEGVVEYVDLEGGFYKVGEWSLMGEMDFASYEGKVVSVTGKEFDGISIRMVKSLVVSQIAVKGEAETKGKDPVEPVNADGLLSLEGTIEYTDLEGGFYSIDGWGLMGDEKLFKALEGKRAIIRGKEFDGISIRQSKQIEVSAVMLPVAAGNDLPTEITVNGKKLPPGQGPQVIDGVLMIPLRHVVEMAGGKVKWDPKEQAVFVEMADRTASFWIGGSEAEMNEENVRYIQPNMLPMAKAPVIINGRTLISADALTAVLGLYEIAGTDTTLDLAPLK
ncbi:MAG: copper amine oxidase N-terminal domain-containing protein [Bacillota bacterium]